MENMTIAGNVGTCKLNKGKSVNGSPARDFLSFSVAVNSKSGDTENTNWYDCTTSQTSLEQYLTRGQAVVVNGDFKINRYNSDKNGPQVGLQIRANTVRLMGGKKEGQPSGQTNAPDTSDAPAPLPPDDTAGF